MSYTYDQNVIAAMREDDRRRNTRTLVIAMIIIIVIVVLAVIYYLVVKLRASAANAAANNASGSTGTTSTGCSSNANCSGTKPVCNTVSKQCVQCTTGDASACTGTTTHCKPSTNTCVQCNTAADCSNCYACTGNVCVAPTAPAITTAFYTGFDSLHVEWTPTSSATDYLIDYYYNNNPNAAKCATSMCQVDAHSTATTIDIGPGNAACAPGPGSAVYVTAVTPCGNIQSAGYFLDGHNC